MNTGQLMQGVEIGDLIKVINNTYAMDSRINVGQEYFVFYIATDHIAIILDFKEGKISEQAYLKAGQFVITKKVNHDS